MMTTSVQDDGWVTTHVGASGYRADLRARTHVFASDEPTAAGGTDTAATPYELLLGALGACTAMTLRFYADRKKWPLEGATVRLRTARSHATDCEQCESQPVGITTLEREVELRGSLSDEQRSRLLMIADRCPVKQSLERGIQVAGSKPPSSAPSSGV
jgi:putative redox protein